jgi:aminomethyltransferase
MGEIFFKGPNALATLQHLTSNDVSKLKKGQAQYSLLTNFEGGIVDDIIIYCLEENSHYLVCVNAANIEKDHQWMVKNNKGATIENQSDNWGQIAVQGPKALKLLEDVFSKDFSSQKPFQFLELPFQGTQVILAFTGYTGESGAEIFVSKEKVVALWKELMEKGAGLGVQPIGLGARDTLRTEMKYSLYGHEINDETSPLEAGLGWVVKLDKGSFIGSDKISEIKNKGVKRKLIGFKLADRGIPRAGYKLLSIDNKEIGFVTSGTMSPSLEEPIGIGYLNVEFSSEGSRFFVEIRSRKVEALVVSTPFVKKK